MENIKIITHTSYTYETTDGRVFNYPEEAESWQKAIDNFSKIIMLDHQLNPTSEIDFAYYVYIKTRDQLNAFDAVQCYEGMCSHIPDLGIYYYDECTESFCDIDKKIDELKNMREKLYKADEQAHREGGQVKDEDNNN